ncbi:hexokinase type 2 isoform X5 [Halyomorpha halys]|uniref:hexokinase type 2 isoform X5 n=1 Tax=Halyomorpha halys TaxID=286706 RepID=UPI0006D520C1|nr:hexokinase type 2 isoform X4 [Halyomorpha halys]
MRPKTDIISKLCACYSELEVSENGTVDSCDQHDRVLPKIREGCKDFIITDTTLKQVMAKLRTEIDKGLNPKTKSSSSVKCFTTYVQDLPTGQENGKFLALDLGGTNFRVLLITLNGRHFDMQSKIYVIPQDVMVGTSKNLFNHIAVCLADFTMEHKVNKDNLPLGFTFSFPLSQKGLSQGILQRWTKGFNCPEAIGKDVVELLREAIDSHGDLHIDIMAILNDTTGTLMSCAWKNHNTKIGVILGTGTNACYVEKIENVIDFDGDNSKPIVLVNTEWGAFGDNGELEFIKTAYDKEVDQNSINPGSQLHEKLISGMYLGEIVRLILVKFINDKLILEGRVTEQISQRGTLPSEFLSTVESDKRGSFKECRKALATLGYYQVTDEDCNSIRFVCECVSRRAAHLAAAALATLINKMGYSSLTIGVDGSLYRYHPHFHDLMVQKISQLIDDKIMEFSLMLSSDGSGRGAALVAASLKKNVENTPK